MPPLCVLIATHTGVKLGVEGQSLPHSLTDHRLPIPVPLLLTYSSHSSPRVLENQRRGFLSPSSPMGESQRGKEQAFTTWAPGGEEHTHACLH